MSVVIISYPPSAGGNHLKNLLCLSGLFANGSEFDSTIYNNLITGTVHNSSARNVLATVVDRIVNNPDSCWILNGHIGELAPYRTQLLSQARRFIVISIDTADERKILAQRQNRLEQQCHPYWLAEEQPFFYQSTMYETYFDTSKHDILTIPLSHLWHPTLKDGMVLNELNEFLSVNIDPVPVEILHGKWCQANMLT